MSNNKELVHRWFEEVWNQQRAEVIDELLSSEVLAHGIAGEPLQGPESFRQFHTQFTGALPDIHIAVKEVIAQGDLTACRFSGTGTHRGDHLGVPATGKAVTFTGMSFVRWKDGKMVEAWNNVDLPGILMQIGALVKPVPAG